MISWVTNDPRGGEIRVAASAGEKLVTRGGESGHIEIAWIVDSTRSFRSGRSMVSM